MLYSKFSCLPNIWLIVVKTKFRSRVQIVKDDNNEIINRGDSIYQFALFIKLKNLNFYIITNTYIEIDVNVDVDKLNIILSINKHRYVDENIEIDLEFNKDDVEHDDEENKKKNSE